MRLAIAVALVSAMACKGPRRDRTDHEETEPVTPAQEFELAEATIADLGGQMERGERTAVDITRLYLARIEALDRRGPELRAIIELNPDAITDARALDRERAEKGPRGPLHGIPVLIKDNIAADGMETTAGSLALVGHRPKTEAPLVTRLRQAGAVILGKANLSEWANFRSSRSSSGWSARGGQARNPYVLDRSPCGSSSGSGVAVAANLVAVAIGTETDGSIVCPSGTNGIVGIKPTMGLVSGQGIIPIAHSQDIAGPMARTVADAAAVLTAIAEGERAADYSAALDPAGLRGKRIGVARELFGTDPAVIAVMERSIEAMRESGAEIVDPIDLAAPPELDKAELEVLLFELKADMAAYLATLGPGSPKTLADLIAFNQANADTELAIFGQDWFDKSAERGGLDSPEYLEALATSKRLAREQGIDRVIAAGQLDAIIAPTNSPAWPIDHLNGDHYSLGTSTLAAVAGYPNVTVPAGMAGGLPIGISIFGPAYSEPALIAIAHSFEQTVRARRQPRMLETLDF